MKSIKELTEEYAALHNKMTAGERFSDVGQAKLDREFELLVILSKDAGIPEYEYVCKFERGEI